MLNKKPKLVLFDLDGTLCDSIIGLHKVLNQLLNEAKLPNLTLEQLRGQVDKGSIQMIQYAFKLPAEDPRTEPLRQKLLRLYLEKMADYTEFFPGIEKLLTYINDQGIRWGIATNRPQFLMPPLIKKFQLEKRAACLVFADTVKHPKPAPDMLLHACEVTNVTPTETIYVGDTANDMIAANTANMAGIFASYGYLREESNLQDFQFHAKINHPLELITLLQPSNVSTTK